MKTLPSPRLARYVEYYWLTRWDRGAEAPKAAAALLEPCVHLQIQDGRAEVIGVRRSLYRKEISGAGCVIGVRFRPGGFYPFVRRPVSRWTDRIVPAHEALGPPGASIGRSVSALWSELAESPGSADAHAMRIAGALDEALDPLLTHQDPTAGEMALLVASIAASARLRRVVQLARASGHSERTLHRMFERYVGVSPAWVIRRYRLHAAAARIARDANADIGTLAYELGYSDQAHLTRDFRAVVGMAPGAYARARESARAARP